MKKLFLFAILSASLVLSACGAKTPEQQLAENMAANMGDVKDLVQAGQDLEKAFKEGDTASLDQAMETYGKMGAQWEMQEFEQTESIDLPDDFPTELVYDDGKVTSASDNSSEGYVSKSIVIKSTDEFKTIKDFYKNLLSGGNWKISTQSADGESASFDANDSANPNKSVFVYISTTLYSKLTEIQIDYNESM